MFSLQTFFVCSIIGFTLVRSECPCSLDHDVILTCDDHTIDTFPDDLKIEECNIDVGLVRDITLSKQSFKELRGGAFIQFPNLQVISMDYNKIETISADAFLGVPEIQKIHLKRNNISFISEGAFDNLLKLSTLDVRGNPLLKSYNTKAWHFCDRTRTALSIDGDIDVFKHLEKSETTDEYCAYVEDAPAIPICPFIDSTLDCTGQQNLQEMACHIHKLDFTNIIFDFHADNEPPVVENYYEGESNAFIKDFNSLKGTENYTKQLETLRIFNSKFDLSTLPTLTSKRTKEVILRADTVFLTKPLVISHKLTIHARVVSLNATIGMNVTKEVFLNTDDFDVLEFWAAKEETFSIGRAMMRRRKLGLLEILDQLPPTAPPFSTEDSCQRLFINSSETAMDLTGWFDKTFLNLNYVVARTVQSAGTNLNLASQIANFTLDFGFSLEEVQDREIYMAAQKFMAVKKLVEQPDIHNVPSYSIETVTELADVMVERMGQYRQNEILQEEQLFLSMGRIEDMQYQFDIIEQQQEMYFDMEQTVLDAIWAATDNSWDFSFDHRNSIEDTIMGAIGASTEAAFQMQEQEFKELLAKAKENVEHMEDVLEKYQSQERRLEQMADKSMEALDSLRKNLNDKISKMDREVDSFEDDITEWTHEQEANAAVNAIFHFFKAIVNVMRGNYVGAAVDIAAMVKKIKEIIDLINQLMEILDSMGTGGLTNAADPLPTDFKSALQSSTELTKEGPTFDEIKNMAQFRMPAFEDATEGAVDGSKAMEACANVADAGHDMTEATAEFANVMLKLADIKDEIHVAERDLERALEEVERIEQMLIELNEHREDYENYMEEAQRQYEEEVERMKEDYHDMSDELREAFKANITAKFENYKQVFKQSKADYLAQLNKLVQSVINKGYGLKSHSMTQRIMIMKLFMDFCDTYFYHSFSVCNSGEIPLMSDDFEVLLEKLEDIKWDSITSSSNLPGIPIEFGPLPITVEDDFDNYRYPITTLKNQSRIDVNLKDYVFNNYFDQFWRVRINMLRIILLDESGNLLDSPGTGIGQEIQSLITFPTIFNDTDITKESYTFLCQHFFCRADYVTEDGKPVFRSWCSVDQEFTNLNYKPSADGVYTIKLQNADKIGNLDSLAKLKVEFSGSYIPHPNSGKMVEWIE